MSQKCLSPQVLVVGYLCPLNLIVYMILQLFRPFSLCFSCPVHRGSGGLDALLRRDARRPLIVSCRVLVFRHAVCMAELRSAICDYDSCYPYLTLFRCIILRLPLLPMLFKRSAHSAWPLVPKD